MTDNQMIFSIDKNYSAQLQNIYRQTEQARGFGFVQSLQISHMVD